MIAGLLFVIAMVLVWIWIDMPKQDTADDIEAQSYNLMFPQSRMEKVGFGALKVLIIAICAAVGWFIVAII